MSRDFRPRKGHRLFGTWPRDEEPPAGWQRSGTTPLIWRIATGEAADGAVELIAYTQTADCGLPAKDGWHTMRAADLIKKAT